MSQKSFKSLVLKKLIPCIFFITGPNLLANNISTFVFESIEVLSVYDAFSTHLFQFNLFIVILIEVFLEFVGWTLFNEGHAGKVLYVGFNHIHDNGLCLFVFKFVINQDCSHQTFKDISQDLQRAKL